MAYLPQLRIRKKCETYHTSMVMIFIIISDTQMSPNESNSVREREKIQWQIAKEFIVIEGQRKVVKKAVRIKK